MPSHRPVVYIPMSADVVHSGHIRIIRAGAELGEVVIGLNTDEVITAKKKHPPLMHYAERLEVIRNIKGVSSVIPKQAADYRPGLLELKPDYVVHGDDWSSTDRKEVLAALRLWDGTLVELPYTPGISSTLIRKKAGEIPI